MESERLDLIRDRWRLFVCHALYPLPTSLASMLNKNPTVVGTFGLSLILDHRVCLECPCSPEIALIANQSIYMAMLSQSCLAAEQTGV